ncbi:MAG: inner membrane protein alx, partial [Pseudomonadota bacterium]
MESIFQTVAPAWLWATFVAIVLFALFTDFVLLNRKGSHTVNFRQALNWS